MTALELYELVKPLIGTEWEPENLSFDGLDWAEVPRGAYCDNCARCSIEAARALWESSIMDRLLALPTSGPQRAVLMLARVAEGFATDSTKAEFGDWTGHHPTRLHALVAAAEACKQ